MFSETDSSRTEAEQVIGFEPPIRRMLSARFMSAAAIAWLAGSSGYVLVGGAAQTPGAATAFWLLLLPAVLFAAHRFAVAAARGLALPADALLALLPAEERPRFTRRGALGRTGSADALTTLAAEAVRRSERASLAVAEIGRARDEAEGASLAKSQFLANISHQLRTPLNAIVGYATLLQEDAIVASRNDQVADLGRVLQASRNLLELINDILELSRMDVGKTSFQRSIVDIQSLVRSVTSSFDPEQRGSGNSLVADVDEEIGILIGDSGKVRQCLLNLVSNGLKFTQGGEVRLSVSVVQREGAEMIQFAIADNGIGMSPDEAAALFRDTRIEVSDRPSSGPKLGLAITRRLATMMGGNVSVRSVPRKGSVFTLEIPREMPRTLPTEDVLPFIDKLIQAPSPAHKKALVIDDDPLAIDLMRRWLSRLGYAVLTAESGEQGLAIAREQRPDFIFLDILMPGLDGYQVLEMLRADEEISSIPVVVVSVCDDRPAALRAGASDSLNKPVQPHMLEQLLDVYCKRLEGEVLVIEDDEASGELIARIAGQLGLGTRVAGNGAEGLAMARANPPAAVVLDLGLPDMTGFQVMEAMAADDRLKRIPVLVVSGDAVSLSEHQLIERSGGVFHIKGQASPHEIAQSLRMAVSR